MQPNDFKDLSLEELVNMQSKLKSFVDKRLDAKKRDALNKIQSLVTEFELGFDEVVAAIRVTAKRGKAPAIYRNPANPRQTWSGKGDAPTWFTEANDPEKLRIPGA